MKILFLSHTFPYPLNDGARLHTYYLLKELALKHKIFLLCLNDVPVEEPDKKEIEKLGIHLVHAVFHKVPKNPFLRLWNTFFSSIPFCVKQFKSELFEQKLLQFLKSQKIDFIHVYYIPMIPYKKYFMAMPSTFYSADAMSMQFERNFKSELHLFRKFYTYLQWKKVKKYESRWIPEFQGTIVVSPVDRDYLLEHCPNQNIIVSPSGVDTAYFSPQNGNEEEHSVIFRGVMNFFPNVDAARFFYHEIFPWVIKEIPDAKFYIVGKSPPEEFYKWAEKDPHLVVTGTVPDMREWMAKASVAVSPMRIGSGIKNKILESMAMEKPVVATRMSCVSIEIVEGVHLLVEDDPQKFAEKVVELMKDRSKRIQMGKQARQFVEMHHSWKKPAEDFEKLALQAVEIVRTRQNIKS